MVLENISPGCGVRASLMLFSYNPDSPRLARDVLVLGPRAPPNRNPNPVFSVNDTTKCFTTTHNISTFMSGRNKASLMKLQREVPSRINNQYRLQMKVGPI